MSKVTFKFPDMEMRVRRGDRFIALASLHGLFKKMEDERIELTYATLRDILGLLAIEKGE